MLKSVDTLVLITLSNKKILKRPVAQALHENDYALAMHQESHPQIHIYNFLQACKILGLSISLEKTGDFLKSVRDSNPQLLCVTIY